MGTGFSDKQLSEINEKLKKYVVEENNERVVLSPKIVVEVRYEEIQKSPTYKSGYALRFPRLVRFRDDKNPDEANSIQYIKKELI